MNEFKTNLLNGFYPPIASANCNTEKEFITDVLNRRLGTNILEVLTLSGIPRNFRLVDIVDETICLTMQSKEYLIENNREYDDCYDKTCVFTLVNIHHMDKYVQTHNICYCTIDVWERLQCCEACVLKCVSAPSGAFLVESIVSTVCEEPWPIANSNHCCINHIPYDYIAVIDRSKFIEATGSDENYVCKIDRNKQKPIDKAIKRVNKHLSLNHFINRIGDKSLDSYIKAVYDRYDCGIGYWCTERNLPKNFILDLLVEIICGQNGVIGSDETFRSIYHTPQSMKTLNDFISVVLVNLVVNRSETLSFNFIISVCAQFYNDDIVSVIREDTKLDAKARKVCMDYYDSKYKLMLEEFDCSYINTKYALMVINHMKENCI